QGAIDVFRQGLNIDPLSANLYDGLSLALRQQGDVPGAQRAIALATKINGGLPPVNTANSTSVMPGVSK
ncbi:MAG: tetratricopeptide repeat protein, partial [Bryobacteraceae bacterium]